MWKVLYGNLVPISYEISNHTGSWMGKPEASCPPPAPMWMIGEGVRWGIDALANAYRMKRLDVPLILPRPWQKLNSERSGERISIGRNIKHSNIVYQMYHIRNVSALRRLIVLTLYLWAPVSQLPNIVFGMLKGREIYNNKLAGYFNVLKYVGYAAC